MKIIEVVLPLNEEPLNEFKPFVRWLGKFGALVGPKTAREHNIFNLVDKYLRNKKTLSDAEITRLFPSATTPADIARIRKEVETAAKGDFGKIAKKNIKQEQYARGQVRIENLKEKGRAIKAGWGLFMSGYMLTVLYKPIEEYLTQMDYAEQWLNAADPNVRWTIEKYEAYHRSQMLHLLNRLGILLISHVITKAPKLFIRMVSPKIAKVFDSLTAPARIYLLDKVANDETVIKALSIAALEQKFGITFFSDTIGEIATSFEDIIFGAVEQANKATQSVDKTASGTTPTADQPQAGTQPSTSTTPTTTQIPASTQPADQAKPTQQTYKTRGQIDIEKLGPYNPNDWEFYDPYHSKHIKTGKIFSNVDLEDYIKNF